MGVDNVQVIEGRSGGTAVPVSMAAGAATPAKAEDSAHISGDTGDFILGVRQNDDDAAPADNGDYIAFLMNAFGALRVMAQAPTTAYYEQVTGTSQVEIIAAPGAGTRIYIVALRVQQESTIASRVRIQDGSTTIAVVQLAASLGSGLDAQYFVPIRLAANSAFNITPETNTTIGVSVVYYTAAE
jgi:hypothetical protein